MEQALRDLFGGAPEELSTIDVHARARITAVLGGLLLLAGSLTLAGLVNLLSTPRP